MADSQRQLIMDNVVTTLAAASSIKGAVDSRPWEYEHPPRPLSGNGETALPFTWAFETVETVGTDAERSTEDVWPILRIRTETAFRYSSKKADGALERIARALLAEIQAALAADVTRGGRAHDTIEQQSEFWETPTPEIGVVVSDWDVPYMRDRRDPTLRVVNNS